MSTAETFESVGESGQKYIRDSTDSIEALYKDLSSKLGMVQPHQHTLSKKDGNPRTGRIEIAIPDWDGGTSRVEQIIKGFYSGMDYEIVNEEKCAKGVISVRKEKESYWINVMEREGYYLISIIEDFMSKSFSS